MVEMAWSADRARVRIKKFIESVPQGNIVVETFAQYLAESRLIKARAAFDSATFDSRLRIPRNRAITTNGAHVYANLMDFNDVLVDSGRETVASHRRAFEFLHLHYSGCDALVQEFDMQRVDFHGSRLHAVVLSPEGPENEPTRVLKAIAFAAAFRELVGRLGAEYPEFKTRVRVGIDSGPAIAIDGGKSDEPEPLFIGSPANHSAKLAAGDEGSLSEDGIFLSPRAKTASQRPPEAFEDKSGLIRSEYLRKSYEASSLREELLAKGVKLDSVTRLDNAYKKARLALDERRKVPSQVSFSFHYKEPPLKNIIFAEHPPSKAIRMPLASIFADIDGFTNYIDNAIAVGEIAEAVANLHVLRAEMAAVIREDFEGRKVRFVGDCLHGLLAKGTSQATNAMDTIRTAVFAAAGIRSSFQLCTEMLNGIDKLGIAIGIDFGETPICRLGLRGEASVRSACSRATCVSESEQQRCGGSETALGEGAYEDTPAVIRQAFRAGRKIPNLTFPNAELLFGTMPSPYVTRPTAEPVRAHQPVERPMRAHTGG